jgi:hypothetical protein
MAAGNLDGHDAPRRPTAAGIALWHEILPPHWLLRGSCDFG